MPMRDHFHPPLSERTSWEPVHGGWPMVIVQHLNRVLPDRYVAEPRVHLGAQWEVDIAALDRDVGGRPVVDPKAKGVWRRFGHRPRRR
jgi:hypothetical protein